MLTTGSSWGPFTSSDKGLTNLNDVCDRQTSRCEWKVWMQGWVVAETRRRLLTAHTGTGADVGRFSAVAETMHAGARWLSHMSALLPTYQL